MIKFLLWATGVLVLAGGIWWWFRRKRTGAGWDDHMLKKTLKKGE